MMSPSSTPMSVHSNDRSPDVHSLLANLTTGFNANDNLEPLLARFLVSIVELAGAQAGAVRVVTDDAQHLRLVAHLGLPPDVVRAERLVPRDCGMCGLAVGTDLLAWVDDVGRCAHHNQDRYFGLECQRVLAISLPHGDQILGVYNLFFQEHGQLSPQHESILRLIGQLLGFALHNARIERERLRTTVMRERQEMVNEVHDSLAQTLAYVKMRLPLLSDAVLAHDDAHSLKYLDDVKKAVGEVHHNLREVMTYFRTRMDPLGLLHALQGLADGFSERTGISLEIQNSAQNLHLNDEQEVQVFHIIQEALANIAKHSMAKSARLCIQRRAGNLEFLIEDNGQGIGPTRAAAGTGHLGLGIMQGRAQRLGGHIEVGPGVAGGTRVHLVLPLAVGAEVQA